MKKKIFYGSLAILIFGTLIFISGKKKLKKLCVDEKLENNFLANVIAMDLLLQAEDCYNDENFADCINIINSIDENSLTARGKSWVEDLEKALRKERK